jgi:hypothetical protein
MLRGSYDPSIDKINSKSQNVTKDKSLSSKRVSVYVDNDTARAYVVHRGTSNLRDWGTDILMGLGYEGGNRFKHSQKVQQKAERKYGNKNTVTVGHSLGGRLAEKYGKNSSQIITYNKAAVPRSVIASYLNPLPSKQTDIRTRIDPVSFLSRYQRTVNPIKTIVNKTMNPITAHNLDNFKRKNLQPD